MNPDQYRRIDEALGQAINLLEQAKYSASIGELGILQKLEEARTILREQNKRQKSAGEE